MAHTNTLPTRDLFRISFTLKIACLTRRDLARQSLFESCQLLAPYQPPYTAVATTTYDHDGGNNHEESSLDNPNNPPYTAATAATVQHTDGGNYQAMFNVTIFPLICAIINRTGSVSFLAIGDRIGRRIFSEINRKVSHQWSHTAPCHAGQFPPHAWVRARVGLDTTNFPDLTVKIATPQQKNSFLLTAV
ncbi:MAG: hypothetical protein MUF87_20530 [Anaerolineae bacterium]|jgi:hypothetical protein|nr:hypothetical protein [Anaerolineae bacterium]